MPTGFDESRLQVEKLLYEGQGSVARQELAQMESRWAQSAPETGGIAELYTRAGSHSDALRCQKRAATLSPGSPRALYNLATALVATGDLEDAEQTFSRVIELDPNDSDAYYNRATLRQQTPTSNHVEELLSQLDSRQATREGEVALCYALAKELEDLGEYDLSYSFLDRGAHARRRRMSYRVEMDEAAIQKIIEAFDAAAFERVRGPLHARMPGALAQTEGPLFVIGLPRSGTTLVDRILSSHSTVESLGEINDLVLSMMRLLGRSTDKSELIARAAAMDFDALARAYLASTSGYERSRPRFVDKTPLNYLYFGLIHLGLPQAPVIHLRRHPMDSCLAMYRTLFRMGYPFSYDLQDLGRYYLAYHRLMQHWRDTCPAGFLDLDYEALIENQERETRRLLDYCGLEFEPACLEFHRNAAPVATASAAQVRQPLYNTSVQRWRRYESQLAPLAEILQQGGVEIA